MGNCAGSKSSIKKRHKSKVVNETQGTIPSSKANKEDSKNNARKLVKKKGPVADNRLRIEDDNDAPTAIISERPKTEREKEELRKALLSHSLFNSLSNENVRMVIDQMKLYTIGPKEIVFNQGKPGNSFFIINTGKVEIIVNGIIKGFLSKGKGFGELALLHNSERTATIRTLDKATLWGIGRQSFRHAVETVNSHKYNENKQFVDSVPILSLLTNSQKDALLAVMIFQEFAAGHKIVVEGDPGDLLYIIKHGTVSCTFKGKEIRQLSRGEFFGEQALLYNTQRTATVTAVSQVKVLSLGRDELIRVLGSQLQQIIYRNSQRIAVEKSKTLKCLIKSQAETIIDKMIINSYVDGDVVIENGFPKKYKI